MDESKIVIDKPQRIRDLIADLNSDDNTYKNSSGAQVTTREAFIEDPEAVLNSYGITIVETDPKPWLLKEIKYIRDVIEEIPEVKTKYPPIPKTIRKLRKIKGEAGIILPDDDELLIS